MMRKQKDHDFMNAYEVSGYLRIPLGTVYRLTYDGKIKAIKIGKHWRYLRSDIERYFQFGTDFSTEPARKLNNFIERRTCPRINTDLDCRYLINLPRFKVINDTGIIKNLSAGGILIVCQDDRIEIGDPINLDFIDIQTEARVVRKDKNGFGIKFKNIAEDARKAILDFVG